MNTLDKWTAEQCGVGTWEHYLYTANDGERHYATYCIINGENKRFPWSLDDARCREVARTHFRILTSPASNSTMWVAVAKPEEGNPLVHTHIAIAEAEIACLQAIMDSTR